MVQWIAAVWRLGCMLSAAVQTSKQGGSHSNIVRRRLAHGGPDLDVQGVDMAEHAISFQQQQIQMLLASQM